MNLFRNPERILVGIASRKITIFPMMRGRFPTMNHPLVPIGAPGSDGLPLLGPDPWEGVETLVARRRFSR